MHAILKMIKNTHRHPANRILHCIGAPFYVIGAATTINHFLGMQTDLVLGIAMWLAAIAMFTTGHRIENNLGSMTPILLLRLISRKTTRYFITERIHFQRV